MARRRMIDPDFWVDDKISELPMETRLVFISTWTYADDEGYYEENYDRMRASLFPYDSRFNIQKHVELLVDAGRIEVYTLASKKYHKICHFDKYQTISHPSPSDIRKILEDSGGLRSIPQMAPQVKLREVKLSKVKLREVNILSQVETLLSAVRPGTVEMMYELIEIIRLANKTKEISESRKVRELMNLYQIYQQTKDKTMFDNALLITCNKQIPNVNYVKAIVRRQETKPHETFLPPDCRSWDEYKKWKNGRHSV